jgi:tetratricopeptide (TPR) repeat protein
VKGTSDDYHMAFNGHFFAAWAMLQSGRLKEARMEALEAERSADKEHPWDFKVDEQAHAREVLGSIALRAGDSAEARSFFREALTLNEPTHDDADKAVFIADEAAAALDQGDTGKPLLDGLRQAIEVLAKLQDHSDDAIEAALTLARLDMKTGATDEAVQAMAKARAIDSKGDSFAVHLNVLLGDAELKLFMSKASEARQVLQEEISLAKSKGYVYYDLAGEIALARLDARVTPSREATSRLRALGEKADRAGFKGLARQALTSVG